MTRRSPALARSIKLHLGEAAYLQYKATGVYDAPELDRHRDRPQSAKIGHITAWEIHALKGFTGDPGTCLWLLNSEKDAMTWAGRFPGGTVCVKPRLFEETLENVNFIMEQDAKSREQMTSILVACDWTLLGE